MNMYGMILAHAGGLDEMGMLLFPVIVGGGVWLMTRQKKPTTEGERNLRAVREPPKARPPRQKWNGK